MKKYIILIFTLLLFCNACSSGKINLVSSSQSEYIIIIPAYPTNIEKEAASEFQRLIKLSTSVEIAITSDTISRKSHEIIIGNTNRKLPSATESLKSDGFTIQTDKNSLYIQGGNEKGTLYGVYTFFDQYLGYRCYSPTVFKYPTLTDVVIPSGIVDVQVPTNEYRNILYHVTFDPFYRNWHKLDLDKPEWGFWVHTFSVLMSPEKYFNEHPEYFALVDGKRVARQAREYLGSQLCLSNPDVLQIITENLRDEIKKNPEAKYWSVSQNDTWGYPDLDYNCTCDSCATIDNEFGGPSGSIITFVNKVAKFFPDKIISTLAYRYSRKAPANLVPDSNVNIMLCTIECNRNRPIEKDSANLDFCKDFEEWGKLTNNILMWDYVVQFHNYVAPFPNLRTLQPNIQYFTQNGVNAQFQQGNYWKGGEFSELRPYLIARLLWNPNIDIKKELNDFLTGYYEDAAPYISQYIEQIHDELEKSGLKLSIYGNPVDHFNGFMHPDLVVGYEQLFDNAKKSVASKPEVLARVKVAHMPLIYSLFEVAKVKEIEELRVFEKKDGIWSIRKDVKDRLDEFVALCKLNEIPLLKEGHLTPDEYYENIQKELADIVEKANIN